MGSDFYQKLLVFLSQEQNYQGNELQKNQLYVKFNPSKRNEVDDGGKPIIISYRTIINYLKDYY